MTRLVLLLALLSSTAAAQEETSYLRTRFSTLYVGVDGEVTAGNGFAPAPGGRTSIPPQLIGRLTLGSYYFWGRANLFLSIDLARTSLADRSPEQRYSTGILSGVHWYPWRLTEGTLRPFVGIAWAAETYRQVNANGEGAQETLHRVPLHLGVTYLRSLFAFELGLRVVTFNESYYSVSRTESGGLRLPALSGWLGVRFAIGTTPDPAQVSHRERFALRFREEDHGRVLNRIGLGVGFAGAFPITSSSWNVNERPFLGTRPYGATYVDLALSFDLPSWRSAVSLIYRPIPQTTEAYGFKQELMRHALALEYAQYLFEFHGFYPFVGVSVGYNSLRVTETDGGQPVLERRANRFRPTFALGADLLFARLKWMLLRATARYTPGLSVDMPDGKVWFDHLEVEYLQLVIFPARFFLKD